MDAGSSSFFPHPLLNRCHLEILDSLSKTTQEQVCEFSTASLLAVCWGIFSTFWDFRCLMPQIHLTQRLISASYERLNINDETAGGQKSLSQTENDFLERISEWLWWWSDFKSTSELESISFSILLLIWAESRPKLQRLPHKEGPRV